MPRSPAAIEVEGFSCSRTSLVSGDGRDDLVTEGLQPLERVDVREVDDDVLDAFAGLGTERGDHFGRRLATRTQVRLQQRGRLDLGNVAPKRLAMSGEHLQLVTALARIGNQDVARVGVSGDEPQRL